MDEQRLNAFLGKAVGDLGAAVSAVLVSIGDELGFYKALAVEALTAGELASKTGTNERYVREWWIHAVPPRYRDALQYRAGSTTLKMRGGYHCTFWSEACQSNPLARRACACR